MVGTLIRFTARMRIALTALAGLVALLAIGLLPSPAQALVKASYENGYARIVIRDANVSNPRTDMSDGMLFIDLERAISVDASVIPAAIPQVVSAARLDPDGRGLRIALTRDFRTNVIRAGDELYIDVMPAGWTGPLPALPPEAIKRLSDLADAVLIRRDGQVPEVAFRYGLHPTFARLAFVWQGAVSAEMTRSGDEVEVVFSADGNVDLTALKQDMPEELQQVRAGKRDGKLVVQLEVLPSVPVRGFWDEGAYIIDVTTVTSRTLDDLNIAPRAALTLAPPPTPAAAVVPPPPGLDGPAPRAVRDVRLAPGPAPAAATDLEIVVSPPEDPLEITFAFEVPTPAAVFDRGEDVWAVFASERDMDIPALRDRVRSRVAGLDSSRIGDLQIVRLRGVRGRVVEARADGTAWTVAIGEDARTVARTIAPLRGARLDEDEDTGTIDFPITGDLITRDIDLSGLGRTSLALAVSGPQGMPIAQTYVEFTALKSAQGLAVVPRIDGLRLMRTDEGVQARAEAGLQLTQARRAFDLLADDRRHGAAEPRIVFSPTTGAEETERAGQLMRKAASSRDGAIRDAVRLELAEHYVANLLAPEALSVLNALHQDGSETVGSSHAKLLEGVASALMGRAASAREALKTPPLRDDPEARLWLSLVEAEEGRWRQADRAFRDGLSILHAYPPGLQARFRLSAARAALERNDVTTAGEQLERLVVSDLTKGQVNERALLIGRFSQTVGRREDAEKAYEVVIENGERPRAYEAMVRLTDLRHASGTLGLEDAITRLRELAIGWRGDSTEIHALHRLSALELEAGNPREAFEALRQAVRSRPDLDRVAVIQEEMGEAFAELFLDGAADALPAVEALSLYYDFNDLTPVGSRGDEMIRRLADRLISVDLLPKADELLRYQIDNRLRGAARAQVATKLALVQMMDGRPSAALKSLSRTRQANLPRSLAEDRRLIEAQALLASGRTELALETLSVIDSDRAARLRADALWKAERWQEAGEEMERTIGRAWESTQPLSPLQRRHALRGAIAYALAGDTGALDRLRRNLAPRMAGTPDAAAFDVVSQPVGTSSVAFAGVAGTVARTDDLEAFLDEYRARYFAEPGAAEKAPVAEDDAPGRSLEGLDVALNG